MLSFALSFWTVIDLHFTLVIKYASDHPQSWKGPIQWLESDSDKPPLDEDAKAHMDEIIKEREKRALERPWEVRVTALNLSNRQSWDIRDRERPNGEVPPA